MGDPQYGAPHDVIAACRQAHDLPTAGQVCGKRADRQVLDQHTEQPLVQAVCQIEFLTAPDRTKPGFGDQEQHRFAAVRRLMQLAFPTFAGRDAALRIEVEEILVPPAVIRKPVAQGDGLGIVSARMAQKNARHA